METQSTTTAGAGSAASAMRERFRRLLGDRLMRNVGWYSLAEAANRITRLITAIVLARALLPNDFGIAAVAITTFEIVSVLCMNGIGQAIVRARDDELPALMNTARRASWVVCIGAFVIQVLIGLAAAIIIGRPDVFWMILCLGLVYLTLPFGQMHAHLIVRANRLHVLAGIAVVQVALDNILTAAFAFSGFGAWAIVLPKLLTAPIWVIGMRRAQSWKPDRTAGYAPWRPLARFSSAIIASELLVAARFNLDKVLVGAILGLEALGIYYFIFNAGIGFSLSLTNSLAASVYPHLAELAAKPRAMLARYDQLIIRAAIPVSTIIFMQACLATLYVPIVFGARWEPYASLVAALCFSAIAKPAFDSSCQLLRAFGRPRLEVYASAALTFAALMSLTLGLQFGLSTGVIAYTMMVLVAQFTVAVAVRKWLGLQYPKPRPSEDGIGNANAMAAQ
ncbi:MAG: oligosaccharide flippase family protein [Hyphomicrobiaceae bacterium]|nr:oligosaccharide flippase family protein [Hyphomicrobiaceae bacterium]